MQCFAVLFCGWLGGLPNEGEQRQVGRLLTIDEVGHILRGNLHVLEIHIFADILVIVPVNLKDEDAFHLTIEEYLQSLISLIDELVCLHIASTSSLGLTGLRHAWQSIP